MTWRRALLYWACFLVLALYYAVALRQPSGPAPAHLTRAPFITVAAQDIDGMDLRRGEQTIRCRRVDGRWRVVEPAGGAVPSDLIAALVTNLTTLPEVEVVDEGAGDRAQFGLAPPLSHITLALENGKSLAIDLGGRNPAGTAIYAQRGDGPRVFLIGLNVRYYEDLIFQAAS
jgi:hypothetical protein